MRSDIKVLFYAGMLFLLTSGCSVSWTKAIQYGSIETQKVNETVNIDIEHRLIIVPVVINGKEYRFLFDTGAPLSISEKIQESNGYKVISKGTIVDTDNNKEKIEWVQVESINIGEVLFKDQSAFIADFDANPVLKCLDIDGIVGSNLMRQCNWTIDQEKYTLSLFDYSVKTDFDSSIAIPFVSDHQYDMFINVDIGKSKVKNVLVDYGSTGSVSMSKEIFSTLEDRGVFPEIYIDKGVKQSGIIGTPTEFERFITYSDSVRFDDLEMKDVLFRTGKNVSIGNQLLSRFKVTINWSDKHLYLSEYNDVTEKAGLAGFKLGYSDEKGYHVQSVVKESNAYKEGVRQNMKVLKLDSLDFDNGNDICDYAGYKAGNNIFLKLSDGQNITDHYFEKTYFKD